LPKLEFTKEKQLVHSDKMYVYEMILMLVRFMLARFMYLPALSCTFYLHEPQQNNNHSLDISFRVLLTHNEMMFSISIHLGIKVMSLSCYPTDAPLIGSPRYVIILFLIYIRGIHYIHCYMIFIRMYLTFKNVMALG